MDELIKDGKNIKSSEILSTGETNDSQNDEVAKKDRAKLANAYNNYDANAQADRIPEPLAIAIKEESAMNEALLNYKVDNGNIVDKRTNKLAIKNPNKISETEKNSLLMQFGGVLDKSGNITLGTGESKFTLTTNVGSAKTNNKNESTYSIPKEDQERLKKGIEEKNKSGFDIGNIKADFRLTDGSSYEAGVGLGMRKIYEKGELSIKAHFKKLIEIAERNHGIWLECERTFGGDFQKLVGGTAISLDEQGKTILKLSVQDLRKLENVNLGQFGTKSFMGHQFSSAAEVVHKMDNFLREMSFSIVHSKSDNHKFGLLGSQLINDPAFKQYIEYYGYFQGVTRDEAKAKFDFELNKRLKLSVGGGIERIVYNKLGKNVLGDDIQTQDNTKIGPTGELSLTWQPEGDKVRITPGVKASSTMKEVGINTEVMLGNGFSLEGKIGRTQHTGTNRPADTTAYVGFNRIIGSDKDTFDPLFEPTFEEKSKEMLDRLIALRSRPLNKSNIVMLTDTMKGKSASELMGKTNFLKSVEIIGNKMGVPNISSRIATQEGLVLAILMIDYQSRVRFNIGILPSNYKNRLELPVEEFNKINQARKGVTLADLQTQMHGENIYGRGYVDEVSIWKYNKGIGIAENPDGSLDITTSSATLLVGANASGSNPTGLTDLFKTISATTVRITLEQIKELHRRAGANSVNLNFAETGGTFLNLNLTITKGSIHFNTNKQISRMPADLSIEMLNNRVDMRIIDSVIAGQLTIATAADMHFHRGDFTTALVNRFLSGQYSYLVMNGIKAGSYSAADIAKLQAGTLTNAEAEALLSGSAPTTVPGSFDMSTVSDTGTSSNDNYTTSTTPTFTWTGVANATSYEFSSDGGTTYTDIGNVLTYTLPSALTDGTKSIMIRAKNANGTGPATTLNINIDTVAPSGTPSFVGTTPDTKLTSYSGLVLNFSENLTGGNITGITSSNGGAISNISINGAGNVVFDWISPNAEGTIFTINGTDRAGNTFSLTKNISLSTTPDSAPTTVPGSFAMTAATDTGMSSTDMYTSNTTPAFTWTSVANATSYEFSSDGGTTYTDIGNVLTYTLPSALTDGTYSIKVRAKNANGTGPVTTLAVNIDTSNVLTIGDFVTAPDTKSTNYTGLVMNFAGEDIYQIVSVTSSTGGTISNIALPNNGQVTFDWLTPNVAGSTLTFIVKDQAGNSKTLTKNVTLPNDVGPGPDIVPPTTPSFTITEGNYTKTAAINLSVTANADVAGWYVSESSSAPAAGDAGWTASAPTTFTLSAGDGTKNVYIYAKDAAGNVQTNGGTRSIILDTVAPSGTPSFVGTTPDTKLTSYSGLVLSFSENLTGGNITGITSSNGGAISNITINGAGNVVFDWTSPNAAGTQFIITGTDRAGNIFSLTKNITLPNSPLTAPTTVPGSFIITAATDTGVSSGDLYTSSTTPTFTFTKPALATSMEFSSDGGSTWVDIGDVTTYTIPSALSDGNYSVKVRGKNAIGSGPATTLSVNIDTSNVLTIGNFNTAPDTKSTTYNGLVMNFAGEDIYELVSITSSNGGALTYTAGTFVGSNGLISPSEIQFNWATPNNGGSTLSFTVKDQAGNQKVLTKAVTLPNEPNNAPVFGVGSVADTLTLGSPLGGYTLPTATDADAGDILTYSISDPTVLGAGVTFDPATRKLNGTVGGVARTETLTYTVSDGNGGTANIPVIFTIS